MPNANKLDADADADVDADAVVNTGMSVTQKWHSSLITRHDESSKKARHSSTRHDYF